MKQGKQTVELVRWWVYHVRLGTHTLTDLKVAVEAETEAEARGRMPAAWRDANPIYCETVIGLDEVPNLDRWLPMPTKASGAAPS